LRAKTPLHYISGILLRTGDATIYYHDLHVKIAGETGEWLMAKAQIAKLRAMSSEELAKVEI